MARSTGIRQSAWGWEARVQIDGKSRSRTFPTYTAAAKWRAAEIAQAKRRKTTDAASMTLGVSEKDPTGERTTDTYTPTGNPTTTITPAAKTLDTPNGPGELTGVTYTTVATGYQTPSNVTSTYNPTGTPASTTTATGTTTYSHDEAGDLTAQSFAPATGSPLAASSVGYAYTPIGKTKSITNSSYGTTSEPNRRLRLLDNRGLGVGHRLAGTHHHLRRRRQRRGHLSMKRGRVSRA